jgi:hypothetical protein
VPVFRQLYPRRLLASPDSVGDAVLDLDKPGIAIARQHRLEGIVIFSPERPGAPVPVPERVRRLEMGAGNPSHRNRLGGCVGAPAAEQLGQNVGMWSLRTRSVRRRNRLKDFNAADPADEDPMRI